MLKRVRTVAGGVALVVVALVVSIQVISQEKTAPAPPEGESLAEQMAQWAKLNSKGPEHERFKDMLGSWQTSTKMWMAPGMEPMVSEGTAEFRLILDGRYIEQKYHCPSLGGPQGFEGLGLEGYDRTKKKYVSIWMDSMSTGIYISEGTVDPTGKIFTYFGRMDDPMTGQRDKVVKSIARIIDDDKVVFDMYDTLPDGTEFKNMEITYTRNK